MPIEFIPPATACHGVVTIGNFDGVHRGHQAMVARLKQAAARESAPAVVITFEPHPLSVLRPELKLQRLSENRRRTELLLACGADAVCTLPVSPSLLSMEAEDFFEEVLLRKLRVRGVMEGADFRFGRSRMGDIGLLGRLCEEHGITLTVMDAVADGASLISSSRIRQALSEGFAAEAARLLGRPHRLTGRVVKGAGRGTALGFATANLDEIEVQIPAHGVYAGSICIGGKVFPTALSIGPNPTFNDAQNKVECHVLDFDGDLYDEVVDVDLLREIRPLRSFSGADHLQQQIARDIRFTRRTFADRGDSQQDATGASEGATA